MIDDSISTKTSTSGGRYEGQHGNATPPRTEPVSGILNWRSQIDHHGNTHWLADGPDDKQWRISPMLRNMSIWWVDASDYPLESRGRLWLDSGAAKRDIEREHIGIMRFIDARRNTVDEGPNKGPDDRSQNQAAAGLPGRLARRGLPSCNDWWVY